jgi:Tfp pilus assembly protein PilN
MNTSEWLQDLSRIDFVTSVGLHVMHDRIILVRLRKNFQSVKLLEQEACEIPEGDGKQDISGLTGWIPDDVREIALKGEHESRERALRQAILSLIPRFNPARDAFYICVPQDQAIVQQIFLPLAAEANVEQVLDYEIERHLPLRREDVYFDYLPTGRKGDKFGVLVFAIPKRNLATLLDVLASFGVKPKGVETTVTAVANFMLFCQRTLDGPSTIVGMYDDSLELIGVQNRRYGWKQTPEILFSHLVRRNGGWDAAAQDLLRECLRQAGQVYAWGADQEMLQIASEEAATPEDLVAKGNDKLGGHSEIAHPSIIPALGAALRGAREASLNGNLLHSEAKTGQKRGAMSYVNGALAAIMLVAALAWMLVYPIKDELRVRQLQRENQKLEPAVDALRREEDQLLRARKEETFFADLEQRRGEVLRVLDELSKIVPNSAYFSNLRYKSGALEVQGSAENASSLIPLLERSAVFENVGFNAPSNRGRDNRETFSLKADLERPKINPVKSDRPEKAEKTEKMEKPAKP